MNEEKFTWARDDIEVSDEPWDLAYQDEGGLTLVEDVDGLMQYLSQSEDGARDPKGALERFMATRKAQHMPEELRSELEAAGLL